MKILWDMEWNLNRKMGSFYIQEKVRTLRTYLFHEDVTGKEITSKLLERVKELENVSNF